MAVILKNLNNGIPARTCAWQVRIDRGHSVLANPYRMKTDSDKERQFAVAHYKRWFLQNCEKRESVLHELYRLYEIHQKYGKLELYCWCYPKICHGNVIKEFLDNAIRGNCYDDNNC